MHAAQGIPQIDAEIADNSLRELDSGGCPKGEVRKDRVKSAGFYPTSRSLLTSFAV